MRLKLSWSLAAAIAAFAAAADFELPLTLRGVSCAMPHGWTVAATP